MEMTHPDILKTERFGTLEPETEFDYDEYCAVREDEYRDMEEYYEG